MRHYQIQFWSDAKDWAGSAVNQSPQCQKWPFRRCTMQLEQHLLPWGRSENERSWVNLSPEFTGTNLGSRSWSPRLSSSGWKSVWERLILPWQEKSNYLLALLMLNLNRWDETEFALLNLIKRQLSSVGHWYVLMIEEPMTTMHHMVPVATIDQLFSSFE